MTTFFIILGTLVLLGYIINTFSSNKTEPKYDRINDEIDNSDPFPELNEKLLYKTKGIKSFEIRGTYYRDDVTKDDAGGFIGYVLCEDNYHDQNAVAIYNENNKKLGYTPKGNKRLNDSLREWNNSKVFAWGSLDFEEYNEKWYGIVYIPVGLSNSKIDEIKKVFSSSEKIRKISSTKESTIIEYFQALKEHREIEKILSSLKKIEGIFYDFPKTLIPSLSKKLEKEKNWEKLLELENYSDLIENLSETFKNSTLRRIEKAKNNLP